MTETRLSPAVAGREVADLLHAVVAEVGRALSLWSVDLWTFSSDTDTLECRAYWCSDAAAARRSDCTGAVVTLDQSHDLRRLVLVAEVVERHAGDDLAPADAAALIQAGYTLRIDIPLMAGAEVLGVLSLADTTEGRRLTVEEHARLDTLARLAAAVLRAVRLAEAHARRCDTLTGMLAAGSGIAASLSTDEIVAAVRSEASRLLPGVACRADVVVRQDDGTFAPAASVREPGAKESRADALARQAADLGRPEQARSADGQARLLVPFRRDEPADGYLELTAPLNRSFRRQEVELAALLAGQAGMALERARAFRALQGRTATDVVTGLYGRWYFYERLYAEVARARRYRQPLSLVMAELDGDDLSRARGRPFRDAVLAATARLLLASLRDKVDVACRLGVGRFALLLPSTPPGPEAAGLVADRVRRRVGGTLLADDELGELGRFTMSLGVAGFPQDAEDGDELAAVAGDRLARAAAIGGDRVEPPLPEPEEEPEGGAPEGDSD